MNEYLKTFWIILEFSIEKNKNKELKLNIFKESILKSYLNYVSVWIMMSENPFKIHNNHVPSLLTFSLKGQQIRIFEHQFYFNNPIETVINSNIV